MFIVYIIPDAQDVNMRRLVFLVLLMFFPGAVLADIVNDAVNIVCAPELGIFDVHVGNINGKKAQQAFSNNADMIYEKYGWVDLRNIKPDGFVAKCNIDGNQYEVKLTTYHGTYCKGTIFAQLHVTADNVVLMDMPLGDCMAAGCGFDSCYYKINDITISGEEQYLILDGVGPGEKTITTVKWFKDLRTKPIKTLQDI